MLSQTEKNRLALADMIEDEDEPFSMTNWDNCVAGCANRLAGVKWNYTNRATADWIRSAAYFLGLDSQEEAVLFGLVHREDSPKTRTEAANMLRGFLSPRVDKALKEVLATKPIAKPRVKKDVNIPAYVV